MPNLSSIPIRPYQPLWAYHHYYDNLPITDIETQLYVINNQTDLNDIAIESSIGTAGSLAARLAASLQDNGNLITSAVDAAEHSISAHIDVGGYVRMLLTERSKLAGISSGATNLHISIPSDSPIPIWPDNVSTTLNLLNSSTISWRYQNGGLYADSTYTNWLTSGRIYNATPVGSVTNFTTPLAVTYNAGSLRVYINGLRLNTASAIGGYMYSEDTSNETNGVITTGAFFLNTALGSNVIYIDFDRPLS